MFTIRTSGAFTLNYGGILGKVNQETLEQFHKRITKLSAFKRVRPDFSKWPSMQVGDAFRNEEETEKFKEAVEWLRETMDSSEQ